MPVMGNREQSALPAWARTPSARSSPALARMIRERLANGWTSRGIRVLMGTQPTGPYNAESAALYRIHRNVPLHPVGSPRRKPPKRMRAPMTEDGCQPVRTEGVTKATTRIHGNPAPPTPEPPAHVADLWNRLRLADPAATRAEITRRTIAALKAEQG